jgi:ATP-dependent Lhr-like helicase
MGAPVEPARKAQLRALALLRRYGVVSRRAIESEGNAWAWAPVEAALALMELRGAARRGYFVHGLPGVQYALPETVESLRKPLAADRQSATVLCATDPAFVMERDSVGSTGPGRTLPKFIRVPSTFAVFIGGRPVLVAERHGESITTAGAGVAPHEAVQAVAALRDRLCAGTVHHGRVNVLTWDGQPVLKSPGSEVLANAGFRRDYPGMTFDAVRARSAALP